MDLGETIRSKSNARVKALRASFSGKSAKRGDLLGLEGETLLLEAHKSGLSLDTIFIREGFEGAFAAGPLRNVAATSRVVLSDDVFTSAVDTHSPQGVAATWAITEPDFPDELRGTTLVLENIQDPGNLGTLLRSAEAFGVRQVMTTQETVSAWNPKAMRASSGSAFRVPVLRLPLAAIAERLRSAKIKIFAAVVERANATSPDKAELDGTCAILVGNEGAGLSADALELAEQFVRIPCATESLNAAVAGSVLMYEAMRQKLIGSAASTFKERVSA